MKVLLTGITGFVGQNLMPMILNECPEVELLTLNININEAEEKYPNSEYLNCQHIMTTDLNKVVEFNPEIVIHLATLTTSRNDTDIIKPILAANIEFGVLLLDTLQRCSALKLFVNTGSFAEYRFGTSKINDAYLYTATKSAFRNFVEYYSTLNGYKYITAVPYSIYGGKMTEKRLIDYIRESMDSKEPVDMTAGEQILDFTHVNDVAGFFIYILKNKERFYSLQNGDEFHLGTGIGITIRDLAVLIEQKYGKMCNINWGGRPYRDRDTMHAVAPIAKNLEIGWRAKISLKEGI